MNENAIDTADARTWPRINLRKLRRGDLVAESFSTLTGEPFRIEVVLDIDVSTDGWVTVRTNAESWDTQPAAFDSTVPALRLGDSA